MDELIELYESTSSFHDDINEYIEESCKIIKSLENTIILENKLNDLVDTLPDKVTTIEIQNFDGVLKWRYTSDSEWTELIDLTGASTKKEVYVGDQEPTDENVQIWVDTSNKEPSGDTGTINIPTKMSDLENDKDYVSIQDLKDNLSLGLSDDGDNIVLKYKDETLLTISINETKSTI